LPTFHSTWEDSLGAWTCLPSQRVLLLHARHSAWPPSQPAPVPACLLSYLPRNILCLPSVYLGCSLVLLPVVLQKAGRRKEAFALHAVCSATYPLFCFLYAYSFLHIFSLCMLIYLCTSAYLTCWFVLLLAAFVFILFMLVLWAGFCCSLSRIFRVYLTVCCWCGGIATHCAARLNRRIFSLWGMARLRSPSPSCSASGCSTVLAFSVLACASPWLPVYFCLRAVCSRVGHLLPRWMRVACCPEASPPRSILHGPPHSQGDASIAITEERISFLYLPWLCRLLLVARLRSIIQPLCAPLAVAATVLPCTPSRVWRLDDGAFCACNGTKMKNLYCKTFLLVLLHCLDILHLYPAISRDHPSPTAPFCDSRKGGRLLSRCQDLLASGCLCSMPLTPDPSWELSPPQLPSCS